MYGTLAIISRTCMDWNRIPAVIAAFAAERAATSDAPVYGPDHASTGTGLTGCIPYGSCRPGVKGIVNIY